MRDSMIPDEVVDGRQARGAWVAVGDSLHGREAAVCEVVCKQLHTNVGKQQDM